MLKKNPLRNEDVVALQCLSLFEVAVFQAKQRGFVLEQRHRELASTQSKQVKTPVRSINAFSVLVL